MDNRITLTGTGDLLVSIEEENDPSDFLIAIDPGHYLGAPDRRTPQMPNVMQVEDELVLDWDSVTSSLAAGAEAPHEIDTPDGRRTIITADGVVTPSGWNISAERDNPAYGIIQGESQRERIQMREWEFNNAVAEDLIGRLRERGYSVLEVAPADDPRMTGVQARDDDNGVSNARRVRRANNVAPDTNDFGRAADFYLSIHANWDGSNVNEFIGNPRRDRNGIETLHPFIKPNDTRIVTSRDYAVIIQRHLMINGRDYGMRDRTAREPTGDNPDILTDTTMPAVIVEGGFMSNFRDAVLLMDDTFRQRTAERLFDAVNEIYERWLEDQT